MSTRALYLHIPFCKRKCSYCDFTSFATMRGDLLMDAYALALEEQLREAGETGLLEGVETAYMGGGTPTHAGAASVRLAGIVATMCKPREFTVEANPESATLNLLSKFKDAGVTRLSLGVQSLDYGELVALGRIHDAHCAVDALKCAAELGFSVSADLMCAIPLQTTRSWEETLGGVVSAGVSHVSVYPLMIEEGTPFYRAVEAGEMDIPDDSCEADRMVEAEAFLTARGFERYEVASYAKPGCACSHNRAYWNGSSYLGLGTGAASMFNYEDFDVVFRAFPQLDVPCEDIARIRMTCTTDRRALAAHPALSDQDLEVEHLTLREALAEDLMLGARMSCGLSQDLVCRSREVMGTALDDTLASLIADGFLTGDLVPTQKGWLLGNELYGRLWALA